MLSRFQSDPLFRRLVILGIGLLLIGLIAAIGFLIPRAARTVERYTDPLGQAFIAWGSGDEAARADLLTEGRLVCPDAPFILPADGFIGLMYGDPRGPYTAQHPHQGIDIFSSTEPGTVPVYAAYDGYLTRETHWVSSLILRIPDDPLQPGRQIWLYYTHMADVNGNDFIVDDYPPGTHEMFVTQGTLLGYAGNYNGSSPRGVWTHLHFSIVLDNGSGGYTNELEFDNTIDPSRYLGLVLNYGCVEQLPTVCSADPICSDAVLGRGGS
jgi:murein DD-endopeptidase MepM/ murein hydrolase activator NlpD